MKKPNRDGLMEFPETPFDVDLTPED